MTQSKLEFTFKNEKGRVLYKGHDLHRLTMVVMSQVGYTEEQGWEIGDHIYDTWKHLVLTSDAIQEKSSTWRVTNYRDDYMSGINQKRGWFHRGRDLVFQLEGEKANAVEHGWAPPNSAQWGDGIGTYDGEYKDLRPWLLYSGHSQVRTLKPNKKNKAAPFSLYRYLKFDTPKLGQMLENTAQHLLSLENAKQLAEMQTELNEEDRERLLANSRKALQHTARSSLERNKDGDLVFRPLDMRNIPAAKDTYGEHHKWLYNQATMKGPVPFKTVRAAMRHAMHTAQFTVFRTITDSQAQIDRKLFFSKGIKPAKLLIDPNSPVVAAAKEAIINIMSGKNADGSERNGS